MQRSIPVGFESVINWFWGKKKKSFRSHARNSYESLHVFIFQGGKGERERKESGDWEKGQSEEEWEGRERETRTQCNWRIYWLILSVSVNWGGAAGLWPRHQGTKVSEDLGTLTCVPGGWGVMWICMSTYPASPRPPGLPRLPRLYIGTIPGNARL